MIKDFARSACSKILEQCLRGAPGALLALCLAGGLATEAGAQTNFLRLKSFGVGDAGSPEAPLIEGSDGALYGTSTRGGRAEGGTVFKVNKDGTGYAVLRRFPGNDDDGKEPKGGLVEGSDGALYGTTYAGGTNDSGTVFKLNKDGTGYAVLRRFTNGSDGSAPQAGLIKASDGALYGVTPFGGGDRSGTVFKLNEDGTGYAVLHRFSRSGDNGVFPVTALLEGSDGALYGTTYGGGTADNFGTVFKLNKDGSSFAVLRRFTGQPGNDGAVPQGALTEGSDGALYGTTSAGGSADDGTVFKLNNDGTSYAVLHAFTGSPGDGAFPQSKLIKGSDGAMYGTTSEGGTNDFGMVFKLNNDGSGYAVLWKFSGSDNGNAPNGVIEGSDGALYGTTTLGGVNDSGIVFRLKKDGSAYKVVRRFIGSMGSDGAVPFGSLLEGSDGALYGTAAAGGTAGKGAVFKVEKDGNGYSVLRNFMGGDSDGAGPRAGLMEGSDGALYGTTESGAPNDSGTIFKLNKDGSGYTVLRRFTGSNFNRPRPAAALIEGSDGALYGAAVGGGTVAKGFLFKLNKDGTSYLMLRSFSGANGDGSAPDQRLTEGSDGALYGTTPYGGVGGGTLFKINKNGTGYSVLRPFNGTTEGFNPASPLVEGSDGLLYGTTYFGGSGGWGTVFKINRDGTGYATLQAFGHSAENAANPQGLIVIGSDGSLYGTTRYGGTQDSGTVFKVNQEGSNYTVLRKFTKVAGDGTTPQSGLVQGSDRALYGTTVAGGDAGEGTVFKLFGGPPPPLSVTGISWRGAGAGAQLRFSGASSQPFRIEAATNLVNPVWTLQDNIAIGFDGTAQFLDASATNYPARFYRGATP